MANTNLTSLFTDIADAIRTKRQITDTIKPTDFAAQILLISGGSTPAPEKIYRDTVIIPDSYNTGCKGNLTDWNVAEAYTNTTLTWRDNLPYLDFNSGKALKNVANNSTFTFENIDFTANNTAQFTFFNLGGYTTSSTYYRSGIKFVFKNCKFGRLFQNYATAVSKEDLWFEYENCTFGCFSGQGTLKNCKIGGLTTEYADATYRSSVLGNDLVKPMSGTSLENCYLYDLEYPTETSGSGHLDGLQVVNVNGLTLKNVRIEGYDIPYQYSQGGWAYALYLETSANNTTIKDCILNGGGNYGINIAAGENQNHTDNLISRTNSSAAFYNSNSAIGFDYNDTLYVSTIYKDDDNIYVVCTNDTLNDKTLKVVDDAGTEHTFSISKCPKVGSADQSVITEWDDLPFDKVFSIPIGTVNWLKCYDGDTLIRTYRIDDDEV